MSKFLPTLVMVFIGVWGQETEVEVKKMRVEGSFSVQLEPQKSDTSNLGRMLIDKTYEGDLSGQGIGQMLTGMTAVKTSAGYVAMELVTGSLAGKKGSFILQHTGTMSAKGQNLSITVVPDSGTEELEGLSGSMDIKIENGQHFYSFEYTLPDA